MSLIKFERVVSVSSEDPAFPADNLLKSNYYDKKWKCKIPGEKKISIILQLDSSAIITAINVGNYGSAFVEIFVGKSCSPDDFKVLVVASSLMTLQEAKLGENMTDVRFFKEDSFAEPASLEKWDRIKFVCSQPYNKYIQYGLTFVVVYGKSTTSAENAPPTLGNFRLKPKEEADISVGGLFAKRKQSPNAELKGAAAIRAASTSGSISQKPSKLLALYGSSDQEESSEQTPQAKNSTSGNGTSSVLRKDSTKNPKPDTPKGTPRTACNGSPVQSSSSSVNGPIANRTTGNNVRKVFSKKRLEKPFNRLMEDVVFSISGFKNPFRSVLRNKAIAMGAKYKADWDDSCTHLLCAFANTPKFNQVLGQGKITTKDWVEICYSKRQRLPWRRFALHRPDDKLPESEEEIFEFIPATAVSSGEDTEEEIERVQMLNRQTKKGNSQTSSSSNKDINDKTTTSAVSVNLQKDSNKTTVSKDSRKHFSGPEGSGVSLSGVNVVPGSSRRFFNMADIYETDTDVELESSVAKQYGLPPMNEFFEGIHFFICQDITTEERKRLERYIIAHKGSVVNHANMNVGFVISRNYVNVLMTKRFLPLAKAVVPEWFWVCHDQNCLVSTKKFEIIFDDIDTLQ